MGKKAPPSNTAPHVKLAATPRLVDQDHEMKAEVKLVTPEMAEHWLKRNHPANRNLSEASVAALAADMHGGHWRTTHQGICFDAEGYLIDGQHRLSAIVRSGVACKIFVVDDPHGSYQAPLDQGRNRTIANIQGWGFKEVAALTCLRAMENGYPVAERTTMAMAVEAHEHHDQAMREVKGATITGKHITGGVIAAYVWAWPVCRASVIDFGTKVQRGEMIERGDPAYAFREWRAKETYRRPWEVAMAALNCIRHHDCGKELRAVHVGDSGYRATTTRRRALKVPHTPVADVVPTANWAISMSGRRGDDNE